MAGKILVAYATRAGSTGEVAQAVAEALRTRGGGETVDVIPVNEVTDLSPYWAVIIGSAIRYGKWLPEAVDFVAKNQAALAKAPTAFFLVSGYLKDDTPEMRARVSGFLDPVRKILQPDKEGLFAGKTGKGDWRNWDQIRAWAAEAVPAE